MSLLKRNKVSATFSNSRDNDPALIPEFFSAQLTIKSDSTKIIRLNKNDFEGLTNIKDTHNKIQEWMNQKCHKECEGCHGMSSMLHDCMTILERIQQITSKEGFSIEYMSKESKREDPFGTNVFASLFLNHILSLACKIQTELKQYKYQIQDFESRRKLMSDNFQIELELIKSAVSKETEKKILKDTQIKLQELEREKDQMASTIKQKQIRAQKKEKLMMKRIYELSCELEDERLKSRMMMT